MKRKLTIFAAPLNAVGHVNACQRILTPILRRGHRVIFMLESDFAGQLAAIGFEECVMRFKKPSNNGSENLCAAMAQQMFDAKMLGRYSFSEKMANMMAMFHNEHSYRDYEVYDGAVKVALEQYAPDLILIDSGNLLPAIYYSGISWIRQISSAPILWVWDESGQVPPGGSDKSY